MNTGIPRSIVIPYDERSGLAKDVDSSILPPPPPSPRRRPLSLPMSLSAVHHMPPTTSTTIAVDGPPRRPTRRSSLDHNRSMSHLPHQEPQLSQQDQLHDDHFENKSCCQTMTFVDRSLLPSSTSIAMPLKDSSSEPYVFVSLACPSASAVTSPRLNVHGGNTDRSHHGNTDGSHHGNTDESHHHHHRYDNDDDDDDIDIDDDLDRATKAAEHFLSCSFFDGSSNSRRSSNDSSSSRWSCPLSSLEPPKLPKRGYKTTRQEKRNSGEIITATKNECLKSHSHHEETYRAAMKPPKVPSSPPMPLIVTPRLA